MALRNIYLAIALWLPAFAGVSALGQELTNLPVTEYAGQFRTQLVHSIMPYWHDTAVDRVNGGYLLSDNPGQLEKKATEKQLVTQSRMVWGFSHVVNNRLGSAERDYLAAARQGYEFLCQHFYDAENGGYFWTTDLSGKPINMRKIVYGQAFVIYACVEYYRASGDKQALERAVSLWRALQSHAHDARHGGWIEHFERDWRPLPLRSKDAQVEVAGLKSANTHLHLMEAFTELYSVTADREVQKSLAEALDINRRYFYPRRAGESSFHRWPDWKPVIDPGSEGLSYGHNVEFAWLMVRAQRALRQRPDWNHFFAHVDHALKYGCDADRGGLYQLGRDDQPAWQTDKIWWVQAEMLAALIDARTERPKNLEYDHALRRLLGFISKHQADPRDGVWFDTVSAEGRVLKAAKAHNWKANYHDVRAIVRLVLEAAVEPKKRNPADEKGAGKTNVP